MLRRRRRVLFRGGHLCVCFSCVLSALCLSFSSSSCSEVRSVFEYYYLCCPGGFFLFVENVLYVHWCVVLIFFQISKLCLVVAWLFFLLIALLLLVSFCLQQAGSLVIARRGRGLRRSFRSLLSRCWTICVVEESS